eukprot:GHVR01174073.1.p1 GENE.GHVR01174073.1~~GHVR01174073.1.p1  ORF type:complete len:416 (+),score=60.42 GHVR01174073.1:903-2150(+)
MRHTVMNIMKSFIGAAFLFLPDAFKHGGMLFSNVAMVISLGINIITIFRLADCIIPGRETYGDIAEDALGMSGRSVVNLSIWLSQTAFYAVFCIFVATNLTDMIHSIAGCSDTWAINVGIFLIIHVPINMALSCVRRISRFAALIALADVCVVVALGLIFAIVIHRLVVEGPQQVENFNSTKFPLFLGAAAYAWEGIGMVLPVRSCMQEHLKPKFKMITAFTLTLICIIFLLYSSLSYLAFGEDTKTVILSNLPPLQPSLEYATNITFLGVVGYIVQLMYVFSLMGTAPLILFPAIMVVDGLLYPNPTPLPSKRRKWIKNIARGVQVVVVAILSYLLLHQLDNVIAIIGAFAAVPIAYIYPPLCHYKLFPNASKWEKFSNISIIVLGLGLIVFSTVTAIRNWEPREVSGRCNANH